MREEGDLVVIELRKGIGFFSATVGDFPLTSIVLN